MAMTRREPVERAVERFGGDCGCEVHLVDSEVGLLTWHPCARHSAKHMEIRSISIEVGPKP